MEQIGLTFEEILTFGATVGATMAAVNGGMRKFGKMVENFMLSKGWSKPAKKLNGDPRIDKLTELMLELIELNKNQVKESEENRKLCKEMMRDQSESLKKMGYAISRMMEMGEDSGRILRELKDMEIKAEAYRDARLATIANG